MHFLPALLSSGMVLLCIGACQGPVRESPSADDTSPEFATARLQQLATPIIEAIRKGSTAAVDPQLHTAIVYAERLVAHGDPAVKNAAQRLVNLLTQVHDGKFVGDELSFATQLNQALAELPSTEQVEAVHP